jgi:8-oxo-dGTP diphosphatase
MPDTAAPRQPVPPPGDPAPQRPTPAVGIVAVNAAGEVCLIRRGQPPLEGSWSLPGGKVEWGEGVEAAARRELAEETGLVAGPLHLLAVVDGVFTARSTGAVTRHYVLIDYLALVEGQPCASSDAAEARWFCRAAIPGLGLWDETVRIIDLALTHPAAAQAGPGSGAPHSRT